DARRVLRLHALPRRLPAHDGRPRAGARAPRRGARGRAGGDDHRRSRARHARAPGRVPWALPSGAPRAHGLARRARGGGRGLPGHRAPDSLDRTRGCGGRAGSPRRPRAVRGGAERRRDERRGHERRARGLPGGAHGPRVRGAGGGDPDELPALHGRRRDRRRAQAPPRPVRSAPRAGAAGLLAGLAAACTGAEGPERGDAGLLLSAAVSPTPATVGPGRILLSLAGPDGAPIPAARIVVRARAPRGAALADTAVEEAPGRYAVPGFPFDEPGQGAREARAEPPDGRTP